MALVVTRVDGETWLDAVRRQAEPHGLESEVTQSYEAARKEGQDEAPACRSPSSSGASSPLAESLRRCVSPLRATLRRRKSAQPCARPTPSG